MADQAKIWDRFAKKYAERKISNEDAFQKKVTQTQAYLTPESQIFEFGCGTGTIACLHSPCAKHILATDISAKMLEIAKQRAEAKDLTNITFQQGEILDFSHQLNQYDMVLAHSLLHLLGDRTSAISAAFQMLKPGGVFVSSTICLNHIALWVKTLLNLGRLLGLLPHIHFISPEVILEEIKQAGFEIDVSHHPSARAGLFIIARKPAN
ncbi:class I SAM-dependent DNA methyltransferase [Terasakiella pusilla]|uniref:class I SAM-dependent DNA methyltransferase n=1 Tax=Terasakiella pusilla TaxID=64973 RepID=UPI0004921313|nr:class I SAM-dependent methyltransferase [Terasakiella pusilla]